ncbi:efflux transporter outer membrane subunit [Tautonia plasticadhaerens]|uniref:Toluene efflux pump outer membrane protein TtgF n=1 Tax=Tautonia plasticadhaerens TaxID=2527974 RepID=A0A518HEZ6_9BACT|nr:efflux transporter outer membrane subunit [Tautonia plasticadhaerens]QDV39404.1 Toluene efflux pump outer membrane protein TtgF precursor [Tautonia plasticadhaerens]
MDRRRFRPARTLPGLRLCLGRRATLACLLIAALLPCGCVTDGLRQYVRNGFKVGPNYHRPPVPVAPTWIQADDPRVRGPMPRDGDWWRAFQDPTLDVLVARAYRQNPDLRSVGTRVLQARAQQAIAVGNVLPQSQRLLGLYSNGEAGGNPTHIDITAFNLSWELDFWGRCRRQVESANARLDASVEDYDAALVTLLADVATNYVQYRVAQQRIAIARDNLRLQEGLVAVAERQVQVGTATALDVAQLRTLMEQTRSTIPALEIARGQANDQLSILLGEPPRDLEPGLGPAPGGLPMPTIPAAVAAGIPADLVRRRPDVRGAERRVAAQSAQIGVAVAGLFPSISIGTALGHSDVKLGPLAGSGGGLALVIPQFSWDVLNYGRLANNVHLQDARTQELVATYQGRVLTAAREVQTALRGFLRSQEQADALARSAAAAASATAIEGRNFSEIEADVNRLFTLANARLQAQDQLAVARGNIALNLIGVYRALGGGWDLRLRDDRHYEGPIASHSDPLTLGEAPPVTAPPDVRGEEPAAADPSGLPEALPMRAPDPAAVPDAMDQGAGG